LRRFVPTPVYAARKRKHSNGLRPPGSLELHQK